MLKIGLTGGIGSGKTTISGIFRVLGSPVFDADREAKLIMETDAGLISNIKKTFGEESYTNGKVNKPYLANIVFNNPAKLDTLNALVHPATIAAANKWMNDQQTPYVIKEAALMFETGSVSNLDYVVGVHAPQHVRIQRVMDRDNIDREQVLLRMSRQIDEIIKMKLCDFVISNNEQQLLIPQVLQLHARFIDMSFQKKSNSGA
ncbi:dephospho-CoA kinase [Segetibacter sp.]|jgi:dephospho-CoA kinase|uniref:dephospho-CoA kinase n=1 Tax=Segetibacter sp. TaxID=2231182 RepID=UPI0026304AE4|nr:dephospho-CoA kinase [Segetibacter sp.]MCW3080980.1 dephospho-CoA kinase [Segetibacter sp.]